MKYTLFDASGRITMSGVMSPETLGLYANAGIQMLVGVCGDPATHYVEAFSLVEYTTEEQAAIAALKPGWVWQMPERIAVDARTLAPVKLTAIDAIDSLSEGARAKVLVKSTNNIEYQAALADAIKYRDAGFEGTAGPGVTTWTYAKRRQGWTDRQAAENILATAAVWESALMAIRGLRLDSKELVRDATSNYEVDLLLEAFQSTLTAAMAGVQ